NDSAMLRAYQADGYGKSLTMQTTGTLDTTFDGDGIATADASAGGGDQLLGAVAYPGGRIAVAGWNTTAGGGSIGRFNANGSLDTSFNATGIVNVAAAAMDPVNGVCVQPDGKMLAVGGGPGSIFAVSRYG